jgi:hypothetical protein
MTPIPTCPDLGAGFILSFALIVRSHINMSRPGEKSRKVYHAFFVNISRFNKLSDPKNYGDRYMVFPGVEKHLVRVQFFSVHFLVARAEVA